MAKYTVACVDVGFKKHNTITQAAMVVLYFKTREVIETTIAHRLVMQCVTKYRLPETTRRAHKLASGV